MIPSNGIKEKGWDNMKSKFIKSALSYFALALFILCMNNVVLLGYSAIPGIPLYVAKIFTELTLFLISYVVQKKVIFRHKF